MARLSLAKRYAQAAFAVAQEKQQLDLWRLQLWAIEDALKDEDLWTLLSQASVPMPEKEKVIREVFKNVGGLLQNLLCLLVRRGRLALLPEIRKQYTRLLDEYHGREQVQVTSAVPLAEAEQKRIASVIQKVIRREIVLDASVDPGILGGLVIRVGDKLIDGSIRGKLQGLKQELAGKR